jgi:hypothetical protein
MFFQNVQFWEQLQDSGDIWEEVTSSPSQAWLDVAISSDGSKMIAAGDGLFTSSDALR